MPDTTDPATVVSPKVKATAAAGAVVTAALLVASLVGVEVDMDPEELAAIATGVLTLVATVASYLKRDPLRTGSGVQVPDRRP